MEPDDIKKLKKDFEALAESLWRKNGVILQLQRETGRRQSFIDGCPVDERFLLPPMRFELSSGYSLTLWGLEKLRPQDRDNALKEIEKFKMKKGKAAAGNAPACDAP